MSKSLNRILRLASRLILVLFLSFVIILALILVQDFTDYLDEHSDKIIKFGNNPNCNIALSLCSASIINEGEFQKISLSAKKQASGDILVELKAIGFDFEGINSISLSFALLDKDIETKPILFVADRSTHQVVPEKWAVSTQFPADNKQNDGLFIIHLKSSRKEYRTEFSFSFK